MDMKNMNEVNDMNAMRYVKIPSRIKKHAGNGVMSGFFHTFVRSVLNRKILMILRSSLLSVPMTTVTTPALAQGAPGSSVVSRTRLSSDGTKAVVQRVYDNGLGDAVQEVQSFPGSSLPDLVVRHEYDDHRRRVKTWLPVTSSGGGYVSGSAAALLAQSQYSDAAPFTRTEYDGFLLSQPAAQYKAGTQWQAAGKKVSVTYGEYVGAGMYSPRDDTLYITDNTAKFLRTRTADEDGTWSAEYTDLNGRVMISETSLGKTYYMYDQRGNVTHVIPPVLSAYLISHYGYDSQFIDDTDAMVQKYAYIYRYDGRGRCIYRKLPGCEPVYYVYDRTGACILSQDGVQRLAGVWAYSIPDKFGRPAISGVCRNSVSYTAEPLRQCHVYAAYDGTTVPTGGYAVHGITLVSQTLYAAAYHDDYAFIGQHGVPSTLTATTVSGYPIDATVGRGMQTGSATAVLGSSGVTGYTYSAMYYDSRHRVAQVRATDHTGGTVTTCTAYSFTGKPESVRVMRSRSGTGTTAIDRAWTYDGADRPLTVTHSVNGSTPVTLASYTYDALGRVASKVTGGLETTAYAYNIQSWPTKMQGQRFLEVLAYEGTSWGITPSTPRWSGRISAMLWTGSSVTDYRGYRFTYDNTGRLTAANFRTGSSLGTNAQTFNENFTYDAMGNVTSLKRRGPKDSGAGLIDDLVMTYDGNRLVKCDDAVAAQPTYNAAHHFPDLADEDVEYEYDGNGNMTKDLNRDITSIEYNSLNLPRQISFSDHTKVKFTYDAQGSKLRAEYWTVPSMVGPVGPASLGGGAEPMGGGIVGPINPINQNDPQVVTDYCGDMIYRNDTLSMLLTEEGYVTFDERGEPLYHYYLRDHLGSVRIVMRQDGTVEQRNQYYPDGTLFGKQSTGGTVQPYKFGGKELERTLPLDGYDFGARWMDPVVGGRFTTMDPLCEKYYSVSPYAYCGGDPVNAVDPDGKDIYMLFYTTGNNRGDEMFKAAAETRAIDIRNSEKYNPDKDIVVIISIADLGELANQVTKIVDTYSEKYGKTAEFGIWSHSSLDGPSGTTETSSNKLNDQNGKYQMTLEGWENIDFNWGNNASAYFYGCRSGAKGDRQTSFTTEISNLKNFQNVNVFGQTNYSYPSSKTDKRIVTFNVAKNIYSYPTYMVGNNKHNTIISFLWGSAVSPMRQSVNGKTKGFRYQHERR